MPTYDPTTYRLYCSDRGGHRRVLIGTARIMRRKAGAFIRVGYVPDNEQARERLYGVQIHWNRRRQVWLIDCRLCRPIDLPERAKTPVRVLSNRRFLVVLERADTPELRGVVDLSYIT